MGTYKTNLIVMILGILFIIGCSNSSQGIQNVTSLPQDDVEAARLRQESTHTPTALYTTESEQATSTSTSTPTAVSHDATATPLDIDLEDGEARKIALATDTAFQPTPRNELDLGNEPVSIVFEEFYDGFDMRKGWTLSDKLVSLDGRQVVMEGYVAPPLKPKLDFFVLTGVQLSFCPFCSTDADWPDRMALVYLPEPDIIQSQYPVRIVGQLEVGSSIDRETGMVSIVRLYAEEIEILD